MPPLEGARKRLKTYIARAAVSAHTEENGSLVLELSFSYKRLETRFRARSNGCCILERNVYPGNTPVGERKR